MTAALPSQLAPIAITKLTPLANNILITDMSFEVRLSAGGIYLMNDDAKLHGIRPRWGKVYAVGPKQSDVEVGQWVLVAHGRWTRGIKVKDTEGVKTLRRIDPNDILLVSDEQMLDETMGTPL